MIFQKYTNSLETTHICDVCSEAVTNPICPFCLTTEIDAWLTLYPHLRKDLMKKIHKFLDNVSNRITTYGTTCIKCGEKRAFVCTYCFTDFVYRELEKINTGKFVKEEFLDFFNFDFDHTGYTQEEEL